VAAGLWAATRDAVVQGAPKSSPAPADCSIVPVGGRPVRPDRGVAKARAVPGERLRLVWEVKNSSDLFSWPRLPGKGDRQQI
jgi:hypothetical protein